MPIPTDILGNTVISTVSPFFKLCVVVPAAATFVVTVLIILSKSPVTCTFCAVSLYKFVPTPVTPPLLKKNKPSVVLPTPAAVVTIPMWSSSFLIINTSVVVSPWKGNVNVSAGEGVGETLNCELESAISDVDKPTFCPVLNGWFGMRMVLGTRPTSVLRSPMNVSTLWPIPVVPTPTDCLALKNIISFLLDSNFFVLTGTVKLLVNESTLEPKVWAIPEFLNTLIALFLLKILRTFSVSLLFPSPILNDPPIEMLFGISLTNISSTTPFTLPTFIDFANPTDAVDNPALNDPVKLTIVVLNPETTTASWLSISMNGR